MSEDLGFVNIGNALYRRLLHHGYVTLKPVIDGRVSSSGTVQEHRLVYEDAYGVKLDDDVVVHHLNRDKTDNRPENLIALSAADHNKLHAFEERSLDMKTLMELDASMLSSNLYRGTGAHIAVEEALSKLVAYDSTIYHRLVSNGKAFLYPVVGGRVDYDAGIREDRLVYEIEHDVTLPPGAVIEHLNGLSQDNTPDNLVFSGKTVPVRRRKSKQRESVDEGVGDSDRSRTARGTSHMQPLISCEELSELIKANSNSAIARMFGVTAESVANWRKVFGLPSANEQHGWHRGRKTLYERCREAASLEDGNVAGHLEGLPGPSCAPA